MAPQSPSPSSRSPSPARRLFAVYPEDTGNATIDSSLAVGSSVDIALGRAEAGRQQIPTLRDLASIDGFNSEFPNIGRILRGSQGSRGPAIPDVVGLGSLATAVAGNPHPGVGLSGPSSLRPGQLVRGGPVAADKLDEDAKAGDYGDAASAASTLLPAVRDFTPHDRRFTKRCGRIRRADKVARLAGTLQGFIDMGQHSKIVAEIAKEESRWLHEREQLVRGLERDLRERGYRTPHRMHDAVADGDAALGAAAIVEEAGEVTWKVAADHGEKTLQGGELAQKIGAASRNVFAAIELMAAQRAQERQQDEFVDTERRKVLTMMRHQELELASKSAVDKENLLQNMRWARRTAWETSTARERLEHSFEHSQRMGRVKAVFARLSQACSGDQIRLARCVDALRAAAEAERLHLESLANRGSATATMWARANMARERGLWAVQHEKEAGLREISECRDTMQDVWKGSPAVTSSNDGREKAAAQRAGNGTYAIVGPPELQYRALPPSSIADPARREAWAHQYAKAVEQTPWVSASVQTPHGLAWAQWPAEKGPSNMAPGFT